MDTKDSLGRFSRFCSDKNNVLTTMCFSDIRSEEEEEEKRSRERKGQDGILKNEHVRNGKNFVILLMLI